MLKIICPHKEEFTLISRNSHLNLSIYITQFTPQWIPLRLSLVSSRHSNLNLVSVGITFDTYPKSRIGHNLGIVILFLIRK